MLLRVHHVVELHDRILAVSPGLSGIRDQGLLESALHRPDVSAFGFEKFKGPYMKAAALLEAIALFHPFVDGNKRTAMAAAMVYLYLLDIELDFTNEEYESIMLRVVNKRPSTKEIAAWLAAHSKPIEV